MKEKKIILHICARKDQLKSVTEAVKKDDIEIINVDSAAGAFSWLTSNPPPDLMIVDLHMPLVSGWKFCQLIRSPRFSKLSQVPVIITSHVFRQEDTGSMMNIIDVDRIISLPCPAAELRRNITELLSNQKSRKAVTALVIDDDPKILRFINAGLQAYGYDTLQANSTNAGISLFRSEKPDLVVIDHLLGEDTAMSIVPEMLKDKDVAVIIISGYTDPDIIFSYIKEGVASYIEKPFSIRQLIEQIDRARHERAFLMVESLLKSRTESLSKTEHRFRDLYENAPVGYHTISQDGTILSINNTELNWLGYTKDEVINNKTIFDLQTPASAAKGRKVFEELQLTGAARNVELDLVKKDGSPLPVIIDSAKVPNDAEGRYRTIVRDNTRQKIMEKQLLHAQKMESLGVMTQGIAHNFNNLLTPILVSASDLINDFPEDSDEYMVLQDIIESARKGASLVQQMKLFGHPEHEKSVNIKQVIHNTIDMLQKSFPSSITLHTDILSEDASTACDSNQIQQVLLNLALNAQDAMPEGGTITVSLQKFTITPDTTSFSVHARPGSYLVLSVSDTGAGMTPEVQSRIFDPFFTTKSMAKRTGLGLSTAYNIVQEHDGFIHVYSELEEGTNVRVYLPCTEEEKDENKHLIMEDPFPRKHSSSSHSSSDQKCILLIDDDEIILHSTSTILEKSGYKVILAEDGIKGLNLIRKALVHDSLDKHPMIDLVILDVVMPGLSGEKVLSKIRGISSDLPVIIASGYGNTMKITSFLEKGAQDILPKPFEKSTLLETINNVLNPRKA